MLAAIENERWRQITVEGFAPLNDDRHAHGQLSAAASCYTKFASLVLGANEAKRQGDKNVPHVTRGCPPFWPWTPQWWKPKTPRQDLIRAAALIVAEIERIDRAEGRDDATTWTEEQARHWWNKEPADERTMVNDPSTGGVVPAFPATVTLPNGETVKGVATFESGRVSDTQAESSPPCDPGSSTDGGRQLQRG